MSFLTSWRLAGFKIQKQYSKTSVPPVCHAVKITQYFSIHMIIVHTVWNNNPAVTSVHHREPVSCSSCQKVCCYTLPARQHLVTSLLILFSCQTPSRAKLGNETLSEPGRLNRMWELTGMAASAKLWGFLPLPSHRTQDQSPWLTELISTCRFLSAGKLMYRLIIQATLFGENRMRAKRGLLGQHCCCHPWYSWLATPLSLR